MTWPFSPKKTEPKPEPAPHILWQQTTEAQLAAAIQAFAERMNVYEQRLARLEGQKGALASEKKRVEDERDAALAEAARAHESAHALQNPTGSDINEAARVLSSWGYSDGQIKTAAEYVKQNEGLLAQFREEADSEEPLATTMKRNRFLIELALKEKVGVPNGAAQSQGTGKDLG